MSSVPHPQRLSVEEYLAGEERAEVRHEYVAGRLYAMVGTSDRHNLIAANLLSLLRPHTRGTLCQLFVADVKLRLRSAGEDIFYYPDLMVCCDPNDRQRYWRSRPCFLVEVLSEASDRIDRREKRWAYQGIETLEGYLLLAQDRIAATLYRRSNDWRAEELTSGDVPVDCLGVRVPTAAIYEDVPDLVV
jgi:Uma2 family endonuclease